MDVANLYVHFPFCRRKCTYCALYSRAGASPADRDAYVTRIAREIASCAFDSLPLKTIYFGGGSPALCDLGKLASALRPLCGSGTEFTVELHPLDVTEDLLQVLSGIGVNRVSMGVQALDDAVLSAMGRGYTFDLAECAFRRVKEHFDNAGVDLIVGYPGERTTDEDLRWARLREWGLRHCSVYALQNERGLPDVPDDDAVLDRIRRVAVCLRAMGLERYEISNYAVSGFACRHNLAVWRGEDYIGLGEGACGRIGRLRTMVTKSGVSRSEVSPAEDLKERTIFRLRTCEGLDSSRHPEWRKVLDGFADEGLLTRKGLVYILTERGTEVCDSILAELV